MDVTVVDITGVADAAPGDVVTFLGRDGQSHISVDEVARLVETISYEILTGFTPRLERVWLEGDSGS
jgi:alanine racemase